MAKHNDMPELNSTKVFLTNLYTKEHLKPPCQHPLTSTTCAHTRRRALRTPSHGGLQALKQYGLPAKHRNGFENRLRKRKELYLTKPGFFHSAAALSGDSDMNGFTVYDFYRNHDWLKDELTGFAKNLRKCRS